MTMAGAHQKVRSKVIQNRLYKPSSNKMRVTATTTLWQRRWTHQNNEKGIFPRKRYLNQGSKVYGQGSSDSEEKGRRKHPKRWHPTKILLLYLRSILSHHFFTNALGLDVGDTEVEAVGEAVHASVVQNVRQSPGKKGMNARSGNGSENWWSGSL